MIIRTRIITVIALTIILAVGITTGILTKVQYDMIIRAKFQDTVFLCDIIERTTESAMKGNKTQEIQEILQNIGGNPEILTLRILSPEGRILRSHHPSEIGKTAADFPAAAQFSR